MFYRLLIAPLSFGITPTFEHGLYLPELSIRCFDLTFTHFTIFHSWRLELYCIVPICGVLLDRAVSLGPPAPVAPVPPAAPVPHRTPIRPGTRPTVRVPVCGCVSRCRPCDPRPGVRAAPVHLSPALRRRLPITSRLLRSPCTGYGGHGSPQRSHVYAVVSDSIPASHPSQCDRSLRLSGLFVTACYQGGRYHHGITTRDTYFLDCN